MEVTAAGLWVLTALGGASMAALWLTGGGPAQHREGVSRISPGRLGAHAALAAAGLVLWLVHVVSDDDVFGWMALALLPVVAGIGSLMLLTWLAGRGADSGAEGAAEQRFPAALVAAHGAGAVLTLAAVVAALVS